MKLVLCIVFFLAVLTQVLCETVEDKSKVQVKSSGWGSAWPGWTGGSGGWTGGSGGWNGGSGWGTGGGGLGALLQYILAFVWGLIQALLGGFGGP